MSLAMSNRLGIAFVSLLALAGCGASRTTYARYPGAPPTFDKAGSTPQAVEVAEKVLAAAGGAAAWDKARQIKWEQTHTVNGQPPSQGEEAFDRWNQRHYGRVNTEQGSAIVAYEVYGSFATTFAESKSGKKQLIEGAERGAAVKLAKTELQQDVTVMLMPFLMLEPGNKLEYGEPMKDGDNEYHKVKITFGDGDKLRAGLIYYAIIDKKTDVIRRVDIEAVGSSDKIGFELSDWTEAAGLKFPGTRKNLGSGELKQSKNFKIGEPDDTLYMMPLMNS
jgi:hypothetical protein